MNVVGPYAKGSRTQIRLACPTCGIATIISLPLYLLRSWPFLGACPKHHYLSRIVSDRT